MNQSAVRFLCSCVVLAAVAAQAQAGSSLSGPVQQAASELEHSVRQREADAHKMVQQEAFKNVVSKSILIAQLQASLQLQPLLAMADQRLTGQGIEPSAD